ncbi:iron ABC transporter permease [Pseudomonas sp. S75]|uniref:FecCD family ABC transporter permease n=1 Tax=unclassified Pseudomonas TaxID=196821 RepID=UPI001907BC83|nr:MULTISPECIES: iron ABC transporter permease [unclassified Pseudomonas]MBJ9978167.1 iron ABC transporter permease [Pseudomonas sp. S30]MBK0155998.1 iron ABC transporter permease [Pseudomonas sp. S75]
MDNLVVGRLGAFSRRVAPLTVRRLGLALLLTLALMLLTLSLGKVALSPSALWEGLGGPGDTGIGFIVQQLRLPRLLLGGLIGAALAVSGLILQALIRNPLASPDLLGLSSGASTAAVLYLSTLAGSWGLGGLPAAAMLGAGGAVLAIYLLAWQQGVSPLRLVLIGVGVSAMLAAATTFMLVFSPQTTTLSAYVWLTGSVYGADWSAVGSLALCLVGLWLLLVPLARQVMVQQLDEALATGLGVRVQLMRAALLAVSAALAGAAIAWGGAMAFVGLIAPHIARRLVPPGFVGQAIMAALVGANLVMLGDLAGRALLPPLDLPAGIFVAAFGAPYFLYLLIKQRH